MDGGTRARSHDFITIFDHLTVAPANLAYSKIIHTQIRRQDIYLAFRNIYSIPNKANIFKINVNAVPEYEYDIACVLVSSQFASTNTPSLKKIKKQTNCFK